MAIPWKERENVMGKCGGDPTMAAKGVELKKQLQRLVKAIVDDDDVNVEAIERAQLMLKDLKLKTKTKTSNLDDDDRLGTVPEEFKCPISMELMTDPVIIASGQTFEGAYIEKWMKAGNRRCPRTQQLLSHTILTPNHLIQEMISQWCIIHGLKLPESLPHTIHDSLTEVDRLHFLRLLHKMMSTLSDQKDAAKEFRLLTKRIPSFPTLFTESLDTIPLLLHPLSQEEPLDLDLQEDLITTLLNLSIHDNNKKLVAETPVVIPLLISALRSGTIETRSNAAATLFTLSALDSNKALIGKSGALKPLIELLDEGNPLAMKDVASAIFNLCIVDVNRVRAVRDGVVRVILKKLLSRVHIDELLSILAMLSTSQKGIEEMGELGGVSCLLGIIRETSCCARNKENCVAILYAICFSDRSKLKEMRDEESTYHTVSQLAQSGTSRAKRKANGILDRMDRIVNYTHTA